MPGATDVHGCTNAAGGRMPEATEIQRFEDDVRGAIAVRDLEIVAHLVHCSNELVASAVAHSWATPLLA